jgi:hypothetical protein
MRTVLGLVCCGMLACAASFGWMRQQSIAGLNRQNATLRQSLEEIYRLKQAQRLATPVVVDLNELQRLRGEREELMKLRAEIGRLHQIQRVQLPELQQQVESTFAQVEAAKKSGQDLIAWRDAKLKSKPIAEELSSFMNDIHSLAERDGGKLPASASDLQFLVSLLPPNKAKARIFEQFDRTLQTFEFIPQDHGLTTNVPAPVLVREINPRALPDGSWGRYYAYANGAIEEIVSQSGDFLDWEKSHQAKASIVK